MHEVAGSNSRQDLIHFILTKAPGSVTIHRSLGLELMNLSEEQPALDRDSSTPLVSMRGLLKIPRKINKVGVSFGSNSLVP